MSFDVQSGIPSLLTAGDAVSFTVTDSNFPAGTWTSKVVFKDESGKVTLFDGTQSGTDHLFTLTNANTKKLSAGANLVCVQFSDGSHRQSSDWSELEVLPDPAAAEQPSFAQQQVTLIRQVIQKLQANRFQSVNFNGQSFTQNNVKDLQSQLVYWEAKVIREGKQARASRGLHNCSGISPAFVSPSQSIPPFNTVPQ